MDEEPSVRQADDRHPGSGLDSPEARGRSSVKTRSATHTNIAGMSDLGAILANLAFVQGVYSERRRMSNATTIIVQAT